MARLADYLALITSQHADKPRFVAAVQAAIQAWVDMQVVAAGMPSIFDLDNAVASQLDSLGLWIGVSRIVDITIPGAPGLWFSFDSPGRGFDEGMWSARAGPSRLAVKVLGDPAYRILLRARIVNNQWHGSIDQAYAIWDVLFAGTPYSIRLHDNQDMTMEMDLLVPDPLAVDSVIKGLFEGGYLDIKPAGVTMLRRTLVEAS